MASRQMFVLPLLLILTAVIQVHTLQCYVCNNCATGYESSAATCQNPETESTTTSSSTEGVTEGGENSTTSTEGVTDGGENSTTTLSPSTDAPAINETTQSPSTDETPALNETTQNPSTDETPSLNETTQSPNPEVPAPNGTTTDNTEIDVVEKGLAQDRVRRSASLFRATTTQPRCVVTSYIDNGTTIVKRGCSYGESVTDGTRCKNLVGGNYNGTVGRCYVCDVDKCNSATKSAIALVPLIVGIIINYL